MANGPRKELSFLDKALMNKAATQGGVLNFLGKQPEVTAPVKAQSHADSPPVQLAYITDAEKDLLVKSNIHGSLAGKPNPGPAGIPSLDDFFTTPGGGIGGGSTSNTGGSVGGGGSQGGGSSAEDYGVQPGQAVTSPNNQNQGGGNVIAPNPDGSGGIVTLTPEQVQAQADSNINVLTGEVGIGGQTENQQLSFQNYLDKLAVDAVRTGNTSDPKFNIFNLMPGYNVGKGVQILGNAIFKNVTADKLENENFLSILKGQVLTTDAEKKRYYKRYKDVMTEAGFENFDDFNAALEGASSTGVQGEESQYRLDPASYFDDELYKKALVEDPDNPGKMISEYDLAMRDYPKFLNDLGLRPRSSRFDDQTSGGLTKIAQSNITQYKQFLPDGSDNPNYNPEFLQKVFDARAELDRMGTNWQTGNKNDDNFKNQNQPQGFPSIPGIPSLPIPKPPGDSYPIFGRPPFMPGPPNLLPVPPGVMPPFGRPPFRRPAVERPFDRFPYGDKFERPRPYNYYAQSPQYKFRGVPSLNPEEFNEELKNRFGIG